MEIFHAGSFYGREKTSIIVISRKNRNKWIKL